MFENKTFLAIVPARGGSKRLLNKNILELAGKPLFTWTLDSAFESKYIDKVVVSSDDQQILDIASSYGAETLFRSKELANDTASTYDAVVHAMEHYFDYDYIVLLQPTSPLRLSQHIDEAIELLLLKQADAIISVCEVDHNPLWSNVLDASRDMSNFIKDEIKNTRSQDLKKYYRLNGAIYLCQCHRLLKEKSFFFTNNIYAYLMDKKSSIDIDDWIDFKLAEVLINEK